MTDELPSAVGPDFTFERPPFDSEGVEQRARAALPLAILALLVPTATGVVWLLGWGRGQMWEASIATVLVSAALVTWDAAKLGRRDRNGLERESAGLLFVGMLAFWIFVFPLAYFRRRHFGGPNLGPVAIGSALLFVGAPAASMWMVIAGRPPACTSPEVTTKVQDLARQFYGDDLKSIQDFAETSYDRATNTRHGLCVAETDTGPEELDFRVDKPPGSGLQYFVRLPPPRHPPRCKSPGVVALLNQLAAQVAGPGATVEEPREVAFDRKKHQRQGTCLVRKGDVTQAFRFAVETREHPGAERDYQVFLIPSEVPSLQDAAVIKQLETILRSSPWGKELESLSGIVEERYDRSSNQRFGRGVANLRTEKIPIGISVLWQDAARGQFRVNTWPLELPSCRNPQVVGMLEQRLRQRVPARPVERVDTIEELSYDRENECREGRCVVHDGRSHETVRFRVQWLDRENVIFAVLLESDLPPDATL